MTSPSTASLGHRFMAPLDRSVQLALAWRPNRDVWGATWSFFCGACAALPWAPTPTRLALLVSAWFLAVPLWGMVWVALIGDDPPAGDSGSSARAIEADSWRQRLGLLIPRQGEGAMGALFISLALAVSLDSRLLLPLLMGLVACSLPPLLAGRPAPSRGAARSLCEICCPALIAWLVAGGGRGLPADLRVGAGNLSDLWYWWAVHWPIPFLFLAFSLVYWASIAEPDSAVGRSARSLLVMAYLLAIAILALVGSALLAALVAALFVLQWPYQAGLGEGRRQWHFRATQGLAMLAMLLASLSLAT